MPNRIVRDGILDSKAVNSLSEAGEIFYRRLMSVVDDHGRFEADVELLRTRCFGRQLERWPETRVATALEEVSRVKTQDGFPLVLVYEVGAKQYLEVYNFNQRVRAKISKFPEPTARHAIQAWRDVGGQETDNRLTDDGHPQASRARTSSSSSATSSSVVEVKKENRVVSIFPVSEWFPEWWQLWSTTRGTNHRMSAENAYGLQVTSKPLHDALMQCTASYLLGLENPAKGYNPENFITDQSRDQFTARWPVRAPPNGKLDFVTGVGNSFLKDLEQGKNPLR